MLIRMSGWSASAETPHLILGSGKRPDIRAKIGDKEVLFDVRTNPPPREFQREPPFSLTEETTPWHFGGRALGSVL